ncbi:MAG: aminotransferase class IV [Chloroflexota bacterium]
MKEIVYFNGKLVPRQEAKVSVDDHGFLYGYALFETMRAYQGNIFRLEAHLRRLREGMEVLQLASGLPETDLARACMETLRANNLTEARVRLTVSRGEMADFPGGEATAPTVLVTARLYIPLPPEVYARGYTALLSASTRCAHSPLSGLKSANYLASVLARKEAEAADCPEALLLNERGTIAEGSASNVFFVKDGGLVTPPLESGILPGITREVAMELAQNAGIEIVEREISPAELDSFEEAFLTNSVMEIMPLVGVQDKGKLITIGSGKPEEVTRKLTAAYKALVAKETAARYG